MRMDCERFYRTGLRMQLTMESVRGIMSKVVTRNKHTEQKTGSSQTESKAIGRYKPYPMPLRRLSKAGVVLEQLILGLDC